MLKISTDILPQTCLSYLAFRIAFRDTLERVALWKQFGSQGEPRFGYLSEVPFLQDVPPHIQLDLLAETWSRHLGPDRVQANLVDESVVYAVCETAARVVEDEPTVVPRYLRGGPTEAAVPADGYLASELRALHLGLSNEGDFLLIGQFLDMEPDEAGQLKRQFGLDEQMFEVMFDVLGRWHMSGEFRSNLCGLLTPDEADRAVTVLGVEQPAF